ncbi:MAG: DsbA family protein [Carnobacterium sp.]|uniref:DsbA family protein n=1 Tax=Carnobacterium sp. TaxID=48221 RepID=UPI003314E8BE
MEKNLELIYVWDAYCGWCHGFSKSLKEFHENHPELPLKIVSGGLFSKQPIGNFPHIPEANKRIHKLLGAKFGPAYQSLLEEGTAIIDSEDAAIGFAALRSFAPDRAYYFAAAMQQAFYHDGKSLSDLETYREIAIANGLDPEAVVTKIEDKDCKEEALNDFRKARQLGVTSYPTLLLKKGDELISFGGSDMTPEKLEARLANLIS